MEATQMIRKHKLFVAGIVIGVLAVAVVGATVGNVAGTDTTQTDDTTAHWESTAHHGPHAADGEAHHGSHATDGDGHHTYAHDDHTHANDGTFERGHADESFDHPRSTANGTYDHSHTDVDARIDHTHPHTDGPFDHSDDPRHPYDTVDEHSPRDSTDDHPRESTDRHRRDGPCH